jgi:hypothetical protein
MASRGITTLYQRSAALAETGPMFHRAGNNRTYVPSGRLSPA